MNIESLLKYQDMDRKLFAVEQKISASPYRKKANELSALVKKAQNRATELDAEAEKIISEIDDIKEKYNLNKSKLDELLSGDVDNMSMEDIEKANTLRTKIASNLNILEKMLQKSAENVNHVLAEFNKMRKLNDDARVQYNTCKEKIDEEIKTLEPEKEKLRKQLSNLEKEVDGELMADYKKKRADIFPVLVELRGDHFCGGCSMELPKVAISRIKEKGVITCEYCKRFVYKK